MHELTFHIRVRLLDVGCSKKHYKNVFNYLRDCRVNSILMSMVPGELWSAHFECWIPDGAITAGPPGILAWHPWVVHVWYHACEYYRGEEVPRTAFLLLRSRHAINLKQVS